MEKLNQFLKSLSTYGEKRDPVRSLWRNVLIVALEDALGKLARYLGKAHYCPPFREPAAVLLSTCGGLALRLVTMGEEVDWDEVEEEHIVGACWSDKNYGR